ncbi:translation initiation factor 2 [Roseibium sp. RKSG952]|uniref:translation initiation factor 2 n=1 Tax=Roseibium sp. RKSG952 TaxID=2529384 RepID=UPI0012BBBDD0|nr:translation initiation factor 2 [Roseibium sp. RKSG952]MTI01154.1 translation initiation factor 2 [Roseibium sp. RKSG952]
MKRLVLALGAVSMLTGCATAVRGTTEVVRIYYAPSDAQVVTSTGTTCSMSPCDIKISRKEEFEIVASKTGYERQTVSVKTRVAPKGVAGMAGNVILGGAIGIGVDAVSGATLDHYPNPVLIELEPTNPSNPKTPKGDLSDIKAQIAEKKKDQEKAAQKNVGS